MSTEKNELLGGALEGGLEREIIANIIGGYEQWKAEQAQLDGGRRHHMRGGRAGGQIAGGETEAAEAALEGGKTHEMEGGEDLEGGKKRGRKLSRRRYIKLKSGKRSRRYVCSPTRKRSGKRSMSRKRSRSRSKRRSRRMSSWNRRVSSYRKRHGVSIITAAKALRGT